MIEETEWHDKKASINIKKHEGLTFEEAKEALDDPYSIEEYDEAHSTVEEARYNVIGAVKRKIVVFVVYTPRNDKSRIISARYALSHERKKYYDRLREIYS